MWVAGLDPRVAETRRGGRQFRAQREDRCDFRGAHSVAFAVPLHGVTIAGEKMRAVLVHAHPDRTADRDLLDVEIAAVSSVVDGENRAVNRRDADDADHRSNRNLDAVAPMHDFR